MARQAINETLLLTALAEGNWAEWQDNPLPGMNTAKRLCDTVYWLNRKQKPHLVRFHFHNEVDGEGVTWECVATPEEARHNEKST